MSPPSPVAVPNANSIHLGWPINDRGVFYIRELDVHHGPNNVKSVLTTLSSHPYVEEIVSDGVDQSFQGDFVIGKFDHPYVSSYYYTTFDTHFLHSAISGPTPVSLNNAIASC